MKKNLLKSIFIILLSIASIRNADAQLTALVQKNEKAIFAIFTYDEYGSPSGMGTGFFIDSKGTAITNYHVLDGASKAIIKLNDDTKFEIDKILAANPDADLIKFSVANPANTIFNFLTLSTTVPQKGQSIFVIGNPEGLESTVSEGIVSSIRDLDSFGNIIQITAPISPGSSGSPIMTMDGNVVAVASFQLKEGQNLNFGIETQKIKDLTTEAQPKQLSNLNSDLVIINQKCVENSELVLNSIDFRTDETVVNFSFTNVSMGYGSSMQVWTARNAGDDGFFIQDLETKTKYYMTTASIGTARTDGTSVGLGETKRFTVTFETVPSEVKKINLMEGLASSWSFLNLNLDDYRIQSGKDISNYQKNLALTKLTSKDFTTAKDLLDESLKGNTNDDDAYNILGIISYVMDNKFDALTYFSKAIEINPKNDIYYFNRGRVYYFQGKIDDAIMDVTLAIKSLPTQGDYYQYRAYYYMAEKEWQKAVNDFDVAINLMGDQWDLYRFRGNCKTWLNDFTGACNDWKKAYKLENYQDDDLAKTIKEYCK